MNTLTLKSGRVLHLKAVNWTAVWHILKKFGGPEMLNDEAAMLALKGKAALKAADATEQLFNFCAGWGVIDDPPENELTELEALELIAPEQPHLTRANWIRFVCLEDDTEASAIIGAVLALSAQKMQAVVVQPEPEPVQDEGAALRAQVKALTAQVEALAGQQAQEQEQVEIGGQNDEEGA